jgi:hypothetical protein
MVGDIVLVDAPDVGVGEGEEGHEDPHRGDPD